MGSDGCGARWTSLSWAHCSVCHCTFTSVSLFDAHRKDGACWDLEGVYEQSGVWSTAEGHAAYARKLDNVKLARERRNGN